MAEPVTAPVIVDATGAGVLRATLASPATGNRLGSTMADALVAAIDRAEADSDTHVLVIAAQGNTFCAGMPLGDPTSPDWNLDPGPVRVLLTRLTRSSLITIALVDGTAIGGGVGLAAACDQVVVGPRGRFRLTEVLLGLIPALVLPVIANRVGAHRAFSLALTAEPLSPQKARHLGLADRAGRQPERELRRLLVELRRADAAALQALKRYRTDLYPRPDAWAELITAALRERLADPRVRQRIKALHREESTP